MRRKAGLRGDGGFSLIEVMVVLAIIAGLIATGTLMLGVAQRRKLKQETEGRLSALAAAIEQLKSNDQLQRYPPTSLSKLTFAGFDGAKWNAGANGKNVGIETIYVCFRLPGITVAPSGLDAEGAIGNTDGDTASSVIGKLQKTDLFEYLDAWGNPFVYFSASDYKDATKVEQYVLGNGQEVKVAPLTNEKSGEFQRLGSFQLFSLGPDGKPGTDDDVAYGTM
jgi:prepilin-type N-terminal cleavage/methylation domain-containing protein